MEEWYVPVILSVIPILALVVDTIFGDPRSDWHPVVLIGRVISFWEGLLYPKKGASHGSTFFRGMLTVLLVLATVGLVVGFLVWLSHLGGIVLYAAVSIVVLYFTITPRALARDGLEIYHLLKDGDIVTARKRLSWIVGRDTENLDEGDIARGTIETVAENTTDGIISPLFYFLLFGPIGAALYRAGNTMDLMDGYMNEKHNVFGTYCHGIFDNDEIRRAMVNALRKRKGLEELPIQFRYRKYKESEFDRLAATVRKHFDMDEFYRILENE